MKSLEGAWYTLDSIIQREIYTNASIAAEAPLSRNVSEGIREYMIKLIKGINGMEIINIKDGIATISNGVKTRVIKLDPTEYLEDVNNEIEKIQKEADRLQQIKESIYADQILIAQFLIKNMEG